MIEIMFPSAATGILIGKFRFILFQLASIAQQKSNSACLSRIKEISS